MKMVENIFCGFEPIAYLETLEKQIKEIEDSGERIIQPLIGRSIWEFIVEDLAKIKGERARKLRTRIIKLCKK
jgi:hypothetical protein